MKAHLIYNPTAGPRDVSNVLQRVLSEFQSYGWTVHSSITHRPGDTIRLASTAAKDGCDLVLVSGGDGTVNEAVNGLVGTQTALGTIPVGTGNMWAKQLGFHPPTLANPLRLTEVVDSLARGTIRAVDVGVANGRYFLCWTGVGLDSQITAEMEPRPRYVKRLGMFPYAVAALTVAGDFPGVRTRLSIDGDQIRARTLLVLVSNIQQYCGGLDIAPDGRVDDGLLDVFVFKGLGFKYALRHFLRILSHRYLRDPEVIYRQASYIEVATDPVMPAQLDGDPLMYTPVTIHVVPHALRVLVPSPGPSDLFIDAV